MEYDSLILKKREQAVCRTYTPGEKPELSDITSLCVDNDGVLFAGTKGGLLRHKNGSFKPVTGLKGEIGTLCPYENAVYVSEGDMVFRTENGKVISSQKLDSTVAGICADDTSLWLATRTALYSLDGELFTKKSDFEFGGVNAMTATGKNGVYAVCPQALHILHGKRFQMGNVLKGRSKAPDCSINALAADAYGAIWCGTDEGLYIFDGRSEWLSPKAVHDLPECRVVTVTLGKDGSRYIGTDIGLYVERGTESSFYGAYRWLPDPGVTAVALSHDCKTVYVGTHRGISEISFKEMSLENKALYYESLVPKYFTREGYILGCDARGNELLKGTTHITDNDGLWTAGYIAAESYRYAVTGSDEARDRARLSMKALLKLMRVTGIAGFTARAYRRPGEDKYGDGDPEWHEGKDEKGALEWKGETSSDEMVGHYYASYVYCELVAQEDERKTIATAIAAITDHILRNDYTLCDADGEPTTWAHWSPFELNNDDKWIWEKGINSLELLSFLIITWHLTGEEKYRKEYISLIKKNHYALNAVMYKIHDNHACHIDDKLGFYSILPLMQIEKDPQLLKYYQLGLKWHFTTQKTERCSTWNFIFGALSGESCYLGEAVDTLWEYPLDLIQYPTVNSKRPDVELDGSAAEFGGRTQAAVPLKASERPIGKLSYSAFEVDSDKHDSAEAPTTWLHPYWLGRYYGLIG